MKKFLWVCVLALPLAAVSQQTASAAGFEVNWSGGWNYHFSWGFSCGDKGWCHKGGSDHGVPDCTYCDSSWGSYTGYCLDGYTSAGYGGYAVMPPSVAPAQPVSYGSYGNYGFQPVGYFSAPSYWYGR